MSLLYKEWLKLRLWWTILLVAATILATYLHIRLRLAFEFNEASLIWSSWIYKAYLFYNAYQYAPLAAGAILAALQFLPEIQAHRIRLVFHLPIDETRAITRHLVIGALLLTLLQIPALLIIIATGIQYFPAEWHANFWLTAAPWFLAGYIAYLCTAALLLETNWRHRVLHLLAAAGLINIFLQETFYETYAPLIPLLLLTTILLAALPHISAHRYRRSLT